MQQLKMQLDNYDMMKPAELPEGYKFVFYSDYEKDMKSWLEICGPDCGNSTPELFAAAILNWTDCHPENDLFFIEDPEGKRVATATAISHPDGTGYVHMFWATPACRGKGLGRALMGKTLELLKARGSSPVILTTDDFRLPAIKTYLNNGFRPVIYGGPEDNMEERWAKVLANLGTDAKMQAFIGKL